MISRSVPEAARRRAPSVRTVRWMKGRRCSGLWYARAMVPRAASTGVLACAAFGALLGLAACGDTFVAGVGSGGAAPTPGAGGSTGQGGVGASAGTAGAGGMGVGGGSTSEDAGSGGGQAGGGGAGGGGPVTCGACSAGRACDPELGECVDAGFLRVVGASGGLLCGYTAKGYLAWRSVPLAKPGSTPYVSVRLGVLRIAAEAPDCPDTIGAVDPLETQGTIAPGAFHTVFDVPTGRAFFADSGPKGSAVLRYVDGLPSFGSAPLDLSSSDPAQAPIRIQSGGFLQVGAGPSNKEYQDADAAHAPAVGIPLVLTTDAVRLHFLGEPMDVSHSSAVTAYTVEESGAARVLLCEEGYPGAGCHMLVLAKGAAGDCFSEQGNAAPSTCVDCGVRFTEGKYTCEGGVTWDWDKLVLAPTCACKMGEPRWNRCAGEKASCSELCTALGRSCANECAVNGACVGQSLGMFENETISGQTQCWAKGACSDSTLKCTGAWNTYCCCK